MKKLASEQAQQSAQPPTTSPLAVIPNGLASTHDALPHNRMEGIHVLATTTPTNPGLQMPKEMANRNKRKGFFKEMNALQGTRTVFSDQAAAAAAAAVAVVSGRRLEDGEHEEHGVHGDGTPRRVKQLALVGVHTPMTSTPTTTPGTTPRTAILPRIVPPSEKVLPSNVFVTSREFERVRPPRDVVNGYANGVDRATEEAEAGEAGEAEEYQAGVQAEEVQAGVQAEDDEAMWSRVEQSWDRLPVLISEELGHFKQGTLVAWKELELDLNTFSPELKLHIARVTAVSTDGLVQLDRLKRPVSEDEVWGEYEPGVIGVEEETVLKLSKADVMAGAGKWRVVPSLSV
ncbi:hypothetical protein EHS25_001440 [Saitozyma podzolica]|uniref:Uncharacterized protein n=1 Tax=Saitozyma podzolica TaxID=1890683 RepID=A0A427YGH4_9TREE|nr:hypothetical protein EHS25_001440 [Saitozyma podzolica]